MTATELNQISMSGRMCTDAVYSKREAEIDVVRLQRQHGGDWIVEKYRRMWQCRQVKTRQEQNRDRALMAAQMYADPNFQPFNKDSKMRFGNYYARRDDLKTELDKWAANFSKSPCNSLEWSTTTIEKAAEYEVICTMIAYHENDVSLEDICSTIEDDARRSTECARLSGSTSPMSNLVERARMIAYNKIAKQLRAFIDARNVAIGNIWAYGEGLA